MAYCMLLAVITEKELMIGNTNTVVMEIIKLCLEFLFLSHILYLTGMIFVREIIQLFQYSSIPQCLLSNLAKSQSMFIVSHELM